MESQQCGPAGAAPDGTQAWVLRLVYEYVTLIETDKKYDNTDAFALHDADSDGHYDLKELTSFLTSAKVSGMIIKPGMVAGEIMKFFNNAPTVQRNKLISYLGCAVSQMKGKGQFAKK